MTPRRFMLALLPRGERCCNEICANIAFEFFPHRSHGGFPFRQLFRSQGHDFRITGGSIIFCFPSSLIFDACSFAQTLTS